MKNKKVAFMFVNRFVRQMKLVNQIMNGLP